ncbi:MAG: hypothetical protein JST46_02675 [Bacteroidetes bacterium]|nr:hypothetical protein [Bacteroidota bacterium]
MKHLLCIGLCWFALTHLAFGQKTVAGVDLPGDLLWAGIDRPGDLTVVLRSGEVIKYDKNGRKQGQYRFPLPPTLYDPIDGAQSFFFDRVTNTYGFLDATMTTENRHPMDPAFAISPWLVCPVLHELWILDAADFNIKKTKLHAAAISLEMQLKHLPQKQVEDYTFLREYQNYTFLLDQTSGIHIFNSLGKYVRTEGEPGLAYFNFLGEELYYKKGEELIMIDLYSGEKRKIGLPQACSFALLTDERMYLADTRKVTILEFKP